MDGRTDGQRDGQTVGWMDGWMDDMILCPFQQHFSHIMMVVG